MFCDLDWPINASRRFVSISWASCSFGVRCVEEGDRIPPPQSYGQALKLSVRVSVCLYVYLSRLCIVSRWLKISSNFFLGYIALSFGLKITVASVCLKGTKVGDAILASVLLELSCGKTDIQTNRQTHRAYRSTLDNNICTFVQYTAAPVFYDRVTHYRHHHHHLVQKWWAQSTVIDCDFQPKW